MRLKRCFMPAVVLISAVLLGRPGFAQEVDHWKILALRVAFPREEPDSPTTTGDGKFDLRSFEEAVGDYEYPYDTPPHDRGYFEAHLRALENYYRTVSEGRVEVSFDLFPEGMDESYSLSRTMISYGNGRTPEEVDQKLVELFRDAIATADAAEAELLDFSQYNSIMVFHAGVGHETGVLNDIRSAYLTLEDLDRHLGGPIFADGGASVISSGILLPEAIGTAGTGGLNGTLAKFLGHQMGLPGLSNFRDGLPAIGGWSLMDTGSNRFGAGVVGFVPCHPMIWSKMRRGWVDPVAVTGDTTIRIVATDRTSDLPKAVKVSAGPEEYFLLENRQARRDQDEMPEVLFSRGDSAGVWLSVDAYDAYVPGSGILIWHVDEGIIDERMDSGEGVNDDPLARGIDLEEADGYEDIGNLNNFDRRYEFDGSESDPFFLGGRTLFSSTTLPGSATNLGVPTGIRIDVLSAPQDTMEVRISFERNEPGWPTRVPGGFDGRAPKAADLDGDGREELIAIASDGTVYAWHEEGSLFGTVDGASSSFAVADLEGDGLREIVTAGADGRVSAWHVTAVDPLWSMETGGVLASGPVLADVDPAEGLEIVVGSDDMVMMLGRDGTEMWRAQVVAGEATVGLAVGDLGDGEIGIVGLSERGMISVTGGSGESESLGELAAPPAGPPVLGDLDGDGAMEVVAVSIDGRLLVFDLAERKVAYQVDLGDTVAAGPVLGDLDGDGFLEIVICGVGTVHAWRFNGIAQAEFPARLPLRDHVGSIPSPPVLADLDDDGAMEILFGTPSGYLYALDGSGRQLPEFPLPCNGPVQASPLIGDPDRDGILELFVVTEAGWVHGWELARINAAFRGTRAMWPMGGRDPANTNAYPPSAVSPIPSPKTRLLSDVYCYPNPVDGDQAHLRFFLRRPAGIQVQIFDVAMAPVEDLSAQNARAGVENEIVWDTSGYESGLYVCRVEAVGEGESQVVFVKVAVSK